MTSVSGDESFQRTTLGGGDVAQPGAGEAGKAFGVAGESGRSGDSGGGDAQVLSEDATDAFAETRNFETPDGAVAIIGLLLMPIMPAKAGRLTSRLPLWFTFLVHVLGVMGVVLAVMYYEALYRAFISRNQTVLSLLIQNISEFIDAFRHREVIYGTAIGVVIGELFVVVLGGNLAAAWCARDEPLRQSFTVGLKRFWLYTPMVALIGFIAASVIGPMDALRYSNWQGNAYVETWYAVYYQYVLAGTWVSLIGWGVWVLFRFIGSDRPTMGLHRPPMCEGCGYNLTMRQMNQDCPECGKPVYESIDSLQRPGTPWQRRRDIGFVQGWWTTTLWAFTSPRKLGRSMRIRQHTLNHRSFLIVSLLMNSAMSLIGALMAVIYFILNSWHTDGEEIFLITLITQIYTWCFSLIILLLVGSLAGYISSFFVRRNMLAAGMRGACYSSGFLVAINVMVWLLFALTNIGFEYDLWRELASLLHVHSGFLVFLLWVGFAGIALCFYVGVTSRIAGGMRYANR